MSADAKAWSDGNGWDWVGLHDGDCAAGALPHDQGASLPELLADLERCLGTTGMGLRWHIRVYPDGRTGLVGYRT